MAKNFVIFLLVVVLGGLGFLFYWAFDPKIEIKLRNSEWPPRQQQGE